MQQRRDELFGESAKDAANVQSEDLDEPRYEKKSKPTARTIGHPTRLMNGKGT